VSAGVIERGPRERIRKSLMLLCRGHLGVNERELWSSQTEEQESEIFIHPDFKATVIDIQVNRSRLTTHHDVANLFESHVGSAFS